MTMAVELRMTIDSIVKGLETDLINTRKSSNIQVSRSVAF